MDLRMYILVNEDIKIGKGKLAGQVGHAVATFFHNVYEKNNGLDREFVNEYMSNEQKKIILKCPQYKLEELEGYKYITIRDKGYTQLDPNTLTCVNYGICDVNNVPQWVKELKLYT